MKIHDKIILGLLALVVTGVVFADNPLRTGDVYDLPVMYLNRGVNTIQTANITFAPPIRNNEEILIPSMSGAIFEFSRGGYVETVFAPRVIVNPSTKVVTLTGTVIRDLCYNQARTFTSCNDGRSWPKGTEVRLVNSSRLYNLKLQVDRPNTCTASGCITFTGSGSITPPTFATTAERDRQLGTSGGDVRFACVTGTGLCYLRLAGSWTAIGNTGTENATTTGAGKVQLSTTGAVASRSATGSTGAANVLTANQTTTDYRTDINDYNLVALSGSGLIDPDLLPNVPVTKQNSGVNASSTTFWRGDATWAEPTERAYVLSGAILSSTGTSFANLVADFTGAFRPLRTIPIEAGTMTGGDVLTLQTVFDRSAFLVAEGATGVGYVDAKARVTFGGQNQDITFRVRTNNSDSESFVGKNLITCFIRINTAGASGTFSMQCMTNGPMTQDSGTFTDFTIGYKDIVTGSIDTTSAQTVILSAQILVEEESGDINDADAAVEYEGTVLQLARP